MHERCKLCETLAQVPIVVQCLDQQLTQAPVAFRESTELQLALQMVAQRRCRLGPFRPVRVAVVVRSRGCRLGVTVGMGVRRRPPGVIDWRVIDLLLARRSAFFGRRDGIVAFRRPDPIDLVLLVVHLLEERIARQRLLQLLRELEGRELQQPYGLLQTRGQRQLASLPHFHEDRTH